MANRKVKVGDPVSHEGNWIGHDHEDDDYVVIGFMSGGADPSDPLRRLPNYITTFENDRFKVKCLTEDLEWSKEDEAWFLPGRILTRDQRRAFCILTESSSCSPKVHYSARHALLSDPELAAVALERAIEEREVRSAAVVQVLVDEADEAEEVTGG